jgi:hypothetical protein
MRRMRSPDSQLLHALSAASSERRTTKPGCARALADSKKSYRELLRTRKDLGDGKRNVPSRSNAVAEISNAISERNREVTYRGFNLAAIQIEKGAEQTTMNPMQILAKSNRGRRSVKEKSRII